MRPVNAAAQLPPVRQDARRRQKKIKKKFSGRASASPGCAAQNPGKGLRAGSPRPCTLCTPEWNSGRYLWSLLYYVSRSLLRKGLGLVRNIPAWKYLIGIFAVVWVVLAIMLFISDIPFYVITWSLTIILILSAAIVALAWAYQNNL